MLVWANHRSLFKHDFYFQGSTGNLHSLWVAPSGRRSKVLIKIYRVAERWLELYLHTRVMADPSRKGQNHWRDTWVSLNSVASPGCCPLYITLYLDLHGCLSIALLSNLNRCLQIHECKTNRSDNGSMKLSMSMTIIILPRNGHQRKINWEKYSQFELEKFPLIWKS